MELVRPSTSSGSELEPISDATRAGARSGHRSAWLAFIVAAALATTASGQPVQLLVQEGLPGPGGQPIRDIGQLTANEAGGFAVGLRAWDGSSPVADYIWGNAGEGPGSVLYTAQVKDGVQQLSLALYSAESIGLDDTGGFVYNGRANLTATSLVEIFDSVWSGGELVALENHASILPNKFWNRLVGAGTTAQGAPYFVGTFGPNPDGLTTGGGLFLGSPPQFVYRKGDPLPGVDDLITLNFSMVRATHFSAAANHHISEVPVARGFTNSYDMVVALDGAALEIDGQVVREDDKIPAGLGIPTGWRWDDFYSVGVNEAGDWFLVAHLVGLGSTDILVRNGVLVLEDGDILDGEVFGLSRACMNEMGDLAVGGAILDPSSPSSSIGAIAVNGRIEVRVGDRVDVDGDGVADPGAVLSGVVATPRISGRLAGNRVRLYFKGALDGVDAVFTKEVPLAECYLVLGRQPGSSVFHLGEHAFVPQVADIFASYPVFLDDIPDIVLPTDLPAAGSLVGPAGSGAPGGFSAPGGDRSLGGGSGGGGFGAADVSGGLNDSLALTDFVAQVVMWNPQVFPQQPEQFTHALRVTVRLDGEVLIQPYGSSTGMGIEAELHLDEQGRRIIRFPFTIPGMSR